MQNFKVLDCTLRDGGYYNNWYFSTSFTKNYLSTLAKTNVDIIEIGFRKPINSTSIRLKKVGAFLYSDEKYLSKLNLPEKKQISVMIDLADYSENKGFIKLKKNFGESKNSVISMVRIACNYNDKKKVNKLVRYLKKKKYVVCVNLMKFTILENKQILSFFEFALKSGADFLYLADSFGNCLPSQIKNISKFLKKKIDIRRVGFHSHDNMGNALKNSIAAINEGFGIIDTSLMGMGRGAGNLKLEDFLYYKKRILEKRKIDIFSQDYLHPLKKKYQWGKNQYYNYSAKNNIHPTFVQRFLEEKNLIKNRF